MAVPVLLGILALAVGGCVCVVWAEFGGPRWVRAVATATITVGGVLRFFEKGSRRGSGRTGGDGD
ncbi:hypothetical protein [Streptomyces poonensis]|uniref:hypothetical protein n=1 Tax=Streptomyces poonensis TaxID=68255 RepID=UPI001E502D24|nr:hypothetical protein [Streptomyces poonensis]